MPSESSEPIAIIGASCRFPGSVTTLNSFWQLLVDGVDPIKEIPSERWDINAYYDPDPEKKDKMYIREAGFIENVDQFDPLFFGITPREAIELDPQQRLLLEVSWEAIENADISVSSLKNSDAGVFIGIFNLNYKEILRYSVQNHDTYVATGNLLSTAAGRLSYTFGLQGPCMSIDTACSSALVAVHMACKALRRGECHLALAGGVNLIFSPDDIIDYCKAKMLSPNCRCKTFDRNADGFVRSEGCGVIVLKRLKDALEDRDPIIALIKGSAINQDGRSAGLTVPNSLAQQALISAALDDAQLTPSAIDYIEAHGPGTGLGDTMEVEALTVLSQGRKRPLLLGSVKSNIGHTESAAGIASLIKLALSLQREMIPKNLHFTELNPLIKLKAIPAEIVAKNHPWKRNENIRRGGVSSFGISGTNAHIILEEAPMLKTQVNRVERPLHMLTLSAKDEPALQELINGYQELLLNNELELADIAYSTNTGRSSFDIRLAISATTREKMYAKLNRGEFQIKKASATNSSITFLFTGQGSQYPNMGKQLYETQPIFKYFIDRCADILKKYIDTPLSVLLFQNEGDLDKTDNTQPALFAFEYALAELWASWGIKPDFVMGHSAGEYVAATVAGILSLEDGLKLISARAKLMQTLPPGGAMAAFAVDLATIEQAKVQCSADIEIGAINGPAQTVISGKEEEINKMLEFFKSQNIKTHRLHVSIASHSKLMDPILGEFAEITRSITYHPSKIKFISNLTGRVMRSDEFSSEYWTDHIRKPVRFYEGIKLAHEKGCVLFLEIGPHPVLCGMGSQCFPQGIGIWLPSLRRDHDDWEIILASLGQLYQLGARVDWKGFDAPYHRQKVHLPNYPFQKTRYWPTPISASKINPFSLEQNPVQKIHPLLGHLVVTPLKEKIFENELNVYSLPFLKDYQIYQIPLFPDSCYIELFAAAGRHLLQCNQISLHDIVLEKPIPVFEEHSKLIQLVVYPNQSNQLLMSVYSIVDENCTLHATGCISSAPVETLSPQDWEKLRTKCSKGITPSNFYENLDLQGINLGNDFRTIKQLWRGEKEILAELQVDSGISCFYDPRLLYGCLNALHALYPSSFDTILYSQRFKQITLFSDFESTVRVHVKIIDDTEFTIKADINIFSVAGNLLATIQEFTLSKMLPSKFLDLLEDNNILHNWCYQISWISKKTQAKLYDLSKFKGDSWLIFSEGNELSHYVISQLQSFGCHCITVEPQANFKGKEEILQLLRETNHTNPLQGILYLWGSSTPPSIENDHESNQNDQHLAVRNALYLSQSLATTNFLKMPSINFVTLGVHAIESNNSINLLQTPMIGFLKTLDLEHPELRIRHIDLELGTDPIKNGEYLLSSLLEQEKENQIAYRNSKLYVPKLRNYKENPNKIYSLEIDPNASYLITGGLRGLGLKAAEWLVAKGAKHLVLIGRKAPQEKDLEMINQIRQNGVQIEIAAVDVANKPSLEHLMDRFGKEWPEIKGIIHAAGIIDNGYLLVQDWSRFESVYAPKVLGSWNLHQTSQSKKLDFFILYSSLSSAIGNPGLINYASANSFLDGLAHYRHQLGLPALTINWGTWTEIGLGANLTAIHQKMGFNPISPLWGLKGLEYAMHQAEHELIIANVNWKIFLQKYKREINLLNEIIHLEIQKEEPPKIVSELQNANPFQRKKILKDYLHKIIYDVMLLSQDHAISEDQKFADLVGMDSLMAVDCSNRLHNDFSVSLSPTLLFDEPTLSALCKFFEQKIYPLIGIDSLETKQSKEIIKPKASTIEIKEDEIEKRIAGRFKKLKG